MLYSQGRYAESAEVLDSLTLRMETDPALGFLHARVLCRMDDVDRAIERADQAMSAGLWIGSYAPMIFARELARSGHDQQALQYIARAMECGYENRPHLADDQAFEALRDHPTFRRLAGIPEASGYTRDDGWRHDLEHLRGEIVRLHPSMQALVARDQLNRSIDTLVDEIPSLSDSRVAVRIQKILASLGDGHSVLFVAPTERVRMHRLPVQFMLFADGLFVVTEEGGHTDLIGAEVLEIGGQPTQEALSLLRPYVNRDNEPGFAMFALHWLRFPEVLADAGLEADEEGVILRVRLPDGSVRTRRVDASGSSWTVMDYDAPASVSDLPLWLSRTETPYWFKQLDDIDALYVQVNQIGDRSGGFETFARSLDAGLVSKGTHNLIIDLRRNGGGNSAQRWPLVNLAGAHALRSEAHRVFVITSPFTFSAAQNTLASLIAATDPILVGEPSGSRPNFIGESTPVRLPWSGVGMNVSSRTWQNSHSLDQRRFFAVDLRAPLTSADYFNGRDPSIEAIRSFLPDSSADSP